MHTGRALRLAWAGALAGLVGCSLGLGGLGNPTGPGQDAQPTDDGPSVDSGVEGSGGDADGGGGPPDGGNDGNASDAPLGMDGSQTDGGDAGNPSLCGGGGFLFCDGFENGIQSPAMWDLGLSAEGHVTADSTHVYRGALAFHAKLDAFAGGLPYGPSAQLVHHDMTWPAHIFARAFVYAPQPLPANYTTLFTVAQHAQNLTGMQLNVTPGMGEAWAETIFNDGPNSGTWFDMATMVSAQWLCVEIEVDSGAGKVKVSVDGMALPMLNHPIGMVMPALDQLAIGLFIYNPPAAQGATDVWFDEVAVDNAAIGCTK